MGGVGGSKGGRDTSSGAGGTRKCTVKMWKEMCTGYIHTNMFSVSTQQQHFKKAKKCENTAEEVLLYILCQTEHGLRKLAET